MGASAATTAKTVDRLFARAVAGDPARPLLTWYDDGTGERIELSGVTLENWVAKTANLLVDGCGLGPGDRAAVLLGPHWQTAAVLLGCWCAGLSVAPARPDGPPGPAEVLFTGVPPTAAATDGAGGERFALGLAPMGLPLREVPAGFADYIAEVRGHGDRFTPYQRIEPGDAALHGPAAMAHGELCAAAARRADDLGITAGARVLLDATAHPDPVDWLLAPLSAGATIVLCGRLDSAALATRVPAEKVTVVLTGSPE